MKLLTRYNKFLVAVLSVVLTGLNALFGENPWVQLAISAATLAGVYHAPYVKP